MRPRANLTNRPTIKMDPCMSRREVEMLRVYAARPDWVIVGDLPAPDGITHSMAYKYLRRRGFEVVERIERNMYDEKRLQVWASWTWGDL